MVRGSDSEIMRTLSSSLDGQISNARSSEYSPGKSSKDQRSTKSRRGGFGDSGTMGQNGELPVAPIVQVTSERQLSEEFSAIASSLEPNVDWDRRVTAMLRLEGLVKGGAAEHPAFVELLPTVQYHLGEQLQDRRSAISRQALHLISILVQTCGARAEPLAAALELNILKAQAMSIQIVTEASDACLRTILHYCPSSRLLPLLCTTIRTNKNAKMRVSAAELLLVAVREWDPVLLDKQGEGVEGAIMAAAQDASAETREAGRSAFVAYYAKRPSNAQVMLRRLPDSERSLKEKLQTAVKKTLGSMEVVSDAVVTITRQSSLAASTMSRKTSCDSPSPKRFARVPSLNLPSPRPPTAREPSGFRSARGPSPSPSSGLPPRPQSARVPPSPSSGAAAPRPETAPAFVRPKAVRQSLAGGALRVAPPSAAGFSSHPSPEARSASLVHKRIVRSPSGHALGRQPMDIDEPMGAPPTISRPAIRQPIVAPPSSERMAAAARIIMEPETEDMVVSFEDTIQKLSKSGLSWSDKADLYQDLQRAIEDGSSLIITEGNEEMFDKTVALLKEGIIDSHFKVCAAALEALSAALHCPLLTPTLELNIERLTPGLFLKITDAKEQIRQLACEAADLLPRVLPPESVMHGVAAAINSTKSPKVMCATMDYFAQMVIAGTRRGQDPSQSGAAVGMLTACLPLATHKHPDVRQSALSAVAEVYFASESSANLVRSSLEVMSPRDADTIKRGILQAGGVSMIMEVNRDGTPGLSARSHSRSPSPPVSSRRGSPSPRQGYQTMSPSPSIHSERLGSVGLPSPAPRPLALIEQLNQQQTSPLAVHVPPSPLDPSSQRENSVGLPSAQNRARSPRIPSPLSVRTVPDRAGVHPAVRALIDEDSSEKKESPMSATAVQIRVDATFGAQLASAMQQWPPAPALEDKLEPVLVGLHPVPTVQAMQEALALAPTLESKERAILCDAVKESLQLMLENREANIALLEVGLRTFSELATLMTSSALEHAAPSLLKPLILAQGHDSEAIAFASEKCARQIIGAMHAVSALSMLVPLLPRVDKRPPFEGDRALLSLGVLRLLHLILPSLSNIQISSVVGTVLPPTCVCYTSANAELRKAAVNYLVALHLRLNSEVMTPHMQSLSNAQVKLIEIYVERAQKMQEEEPSSCA